MFTCTGATGNPPIPLSGSLRIEEEALASLSGADFKELEGVYTSGRVRRFLAGLRGIW
jgi:hypothetical protein